MHKTIKKRWGAHTAFLMLGYSVRKMYRKKAEEII